MAPRASQDRPKSPRQSLRQAFSTDQVAPRSLEEASSIDFVDRSGSKRAPKDDFGRSWVDFGSPRGSILVILRWLSARVGRLARRRGDVRKTYKNLCKTIGFYRFFACPLLRARRENRPKIVPNALLDRVACQIAFESRFFRARCLKMVPRALSGASLDALERLLGRSWALLGRSWALLGRSWDALGPLLLRSWAALGRSWVRLDRP